MTIKIRKTIFIIGMILVLLGIFLAIRFFSGEDDWICVNNQWIKHGNPLAPQPVSGCGEQNNLPLSNQYIVVTSPTSNQLVDNPLTVKGKARTFEYYVEYRILDADSSILAAGNFIASTGNDQPPYYGSFTENLAYRAPHGHQGTLEMFESSAKDGTEINKVLIPILFK